MEIMLTGSGVIRIKRIFCALALSLLCGCAFFGSYYAFDDRQTFERAVAAFDNGNYGEALRGFDAAAQSGNADAQYLTGLIYLNGLAGDVNPPLAEKWLAAAANAGHVPAQIQLAYMYKNASFPLYNPAEAYYWFSVLCENGRQYETEMNNLRWTVEQPLKRKVLVPVPARSKTLDYNSLFPAR